MALQLPELATERLLLGDPAAATRPLAVVAHEAQRDLVVAASRAAQKAGVLPGQPATAARALCAALDLRRHEPEHDLARLQSLAEAGLRWTPDVGLDPPWGLLLEIGRTAHLFGGEAALAQAARAQLAALGHRATSGIAATPAAARALARATRRDLRIAEGAEPATALRPLPLAALDPPPAVAELAAVLGFTHAGALLDLPRDGLATRCGDDALRWLDRLLGGLDEPVPRIVPREGFDQRVELWQPASDASILIFAAKRLFDLAEADLWRRNRGLVEARVELALESRGDLLPITLRPPLPSFAARRLVRLFQHRLEATKLPAPVVELRLRFTNTAPLVEAQSLLFDERPAAEALFEDDAVADFVSRLVARLGEERVRLAELADDHRPERGFRWRAAAAPDPGAAAAAGDRDARAPAGRRPLELHGEPAPLAVAEDAEERPVAILEGADRGRLRVLRGPERIESGWWDGGDVRRAYFEVETALGSRLWIFRDRGSRAWRCHGAFS